jgi:hydroxymethylbilane synthase
MTPLRLGTRKSPLALWQARHVADLLTPLAGQRPVELVLIETEGDRVRDRPLSQIGGDGLFTREIQNALLDGRADVAVHSLKDLPTLPVAGLVLAAVPSRGPVGDAFVSHRHPRFDALPPDAVVATSSLRRRSQLLHRRPDLRVESVRGNVETRLRKLDEQGLDAIILAEAGLRRLGLEQHITEILDRQWMLPAVGQGALGLECRAGDDGTRRLLEHLNDPVTRGCVLAERAFLRGLGGGCLVPIGALGTVEGEQLHLRGCVLTTDGQRRVDGEKRGRASTGGQAQPRKSGGHWPTTCWHEGRGSCWVEGPIVALLTGARATARSSGGSGRFGLG